MGDDKMADEKDSNLSRRGMPKYTENPFLAKALATTKTRTRKISSSSGERMMVVSEDSGEVIGPAGFWQTEEVDQTQFVKLFINGVRALKDLTAPGTRVFELLYLEMQKNIGKDQIHLSFAGINHTINDISERTFYRGMQELVAKGFIAESVVVGLYYVNPDYLWNGDRLAFVKTFRLKQTETIKQAMKDTITRSLPFDDPKPEPETQPKAKPARKKAAPKKSKAEESLETFKAAVKKKTS